MSVKPIQIAPWKIPFDVSGNGPYAVRVKLSDLMFDKERHGTPEDPSTWVPWDSGGIKLPHDVIVYDPSIYVEGELNEESPQRRRQKNAIFLSVVTYDDRATQTFISHADYENQTPGDPSTAGYYKIHDPDAALAPLDEYEYRQLDLTFQLVAPPPGSSAHTANDYYRASATVAIQGSDVEDSSLVILSGRDNALEATIPGSDLIPYTRIRLNADPTLEEAYDVVRFFTGYNVGANGLDDTIRPNTIITDEDHFDPTKNVYLQDVEVWVRCAFFADYVDPSSYNQELHSESDVQHQNLILGTGDFNKFERTAVDARPYLPLTPPRADVLSAMLQSSNNVGFFPIPQRNGTYDNPIEEASAPAGWYTPDIATVNDGDEHIVSPSGNIHTSGRIFSPSIDELWVYIKKAVSGRMPDDDPLSDGTPRSTDSSNYSIFSDTRPDPEPSFTLENGKKGDPLNRDGNEFVNTGEGISYVMNAGIRRTADLIQPGITEFKYRPYVAPEDSNNNDRAAFTNIQRDARWGLRSQPMSLRELEAAIKNVQFNAEVSFNFLTTNMVPGGQVEAGEEGTLHRLHRDFNPDAPSMSRWSAANQTKVPMEIEYGETLPGSANFEYDQLSDMDQGDVYLSAEGEWRYLFDHIRTPVIYEQY